MMARAEEQRPRWTEEEDHKLIECKSRNPHLSWPNIAMLAGLERSGKSCRERWNNNLTENNTITRLHRLYGNRTFQTQAPFLHPFQPHKNSSTLASEAQLPRIS
ncbi:hypothetical protein AAG906_004466 [Vitis piasezkii]